MYWANILHIYQPPTQKKWMLERVVNESYRAIINVLRRNPESKITLNIVGCLTQQLAEQSFYDVIEGFKELALAGQIEFTGSSSHHGFLPLLPKKEVMRQIKVNEQINKKYFGDIYKPVGFFSPEGGYSREVAQIVRKLGYRWTLADEVAFTGNIRSYVYKFDALPGFSERGVGAEFKSKDFYLLKDNPTPEELVTYDKMYYLKGSEKKKLFLLFRERILSDAVGSGQIPSADVFFDCLGEEVNKRRYFLTATDGEAYGHHNPGMENMLDEVFRSSKIKTVTVSELLKMFKKSSMPIEPISSSWATSAKEIESENYYSRWKHVKNEIHDAQWELTDVAIKAVEKEEKNLKMDNINPHLNKTNRTSKWLSARKKLDEALHSCHFWWASAYPWWSIEMIEAGAHELMRAIELLPDSASKKRAQNKANELYKKIVFTGFEWMRTGKVNDVSRWHS